MIIFLLWPLSNHSASGENDCRLLAQWWQADNGSLNPLSKMFYTFFQAGTVWTIKWEQTTVSKPHIKLVYWIDLFTELRCRKKTCAFWQGKSLILHLKFLNLNSREMRCFIYLFFFCNCPVFSPLLEVKPHCHCACGDSVVPLILSLLLVV